MTWELPMTLGLSLGLATFVLLAMHPFVTYPLSLRILAGLRHAQEDKCQAAPIDLTRELRPKVAICLCAFNEAAVIVDKLESLLLVAETYGPASIHVYSDGSDDKTALLLEQFRDRVDIVISNERLGKTHGMKVLLERSTSDLVMFTDANVTMDNDALLKLARPFADPHCGCSTAKLRYVNRDEGATALAGAIYWSIEEFVKGIESACGFIMGVDGASFLIRRSLYHAPPDDLIDDLYVTLRVLIDGKRVMRADGLVVEERGSTNAKEEYQRKVRIACQAIRVHRALWPQLRQLPGLLVYAYISHRWMKWMLPYFALGAASCLLALFALFTTPAIAAAGAASVAILLVAGAFLSIPGLSMISSSLIALAGVARGVALAYASDRAFTTWMPANSVRAASDAQPRNRSGRSDQSVNS
ncbi:glycosyltransferase [Novosphingobium sp. YJ-S2-02]|uniref:Glycosyltransferase n=1 Tax=Novosphingobium aureum TaxID=2792964 RepID=A0A931HEM2_9SPHN|nr:glycosyltransferase [Novosphingobium aureum]MBH0113961.1 glycosyltransferase [Novosphingobium aureum]